jgi:hypothetical protein
MDAKNISNSIRPIIGTMATAAALPKTRDCRLCCLLSPEHKCDTCLMQVCKVCWKDPDINPGVTYFVFEKEGKVSYCSNCNPKKSF